MPALIAAGAIDRDADGTIVRVRRRALLNRWTKDYSFLNSNGVTLDYVAPRGLQRLIEHVRDRDDICMTGSAAARTYLPSTSISVIPLTLLAMYAQDPRTLAKELGLVRVGRESSNVIIAPLREPSLLDQSRLSEQGLVAPLGQVLADLLTLPGRMAQEAEQLMDFLSETDLAWRE
ncbi:hypothetical protein [Alloactinosynnema sp. L-07]|nr:hypothetical protein [Alloactinosynnema sp. L-07]